MGLRCKQASGKFLENMDENVDETSGQLWLPTPSQTAACLAFDGEVGWLEFTRAWLEARADGLSSLAGKP